MNARTQVRHPTHDTNHEIWVECHIIAVDTSGMVTYIRVLPCSISKIKSRSTMRSFPKKIKESTCFWVPFTQAWAQERDDDTYDDFVRVNGKVNEWVRQENTKDLEAVRELRSVLLKKKKKNNNNNKKKNKTTTTPNKNTTVTSTTTTTSTPKKRSRSKSFESAERWKLQVTQPREQNMHSSSIFLHIASGGLKKNHDDDDDDEKEYPSPASMHDVPWIELHSGGDKKRKRVEASSTQGKEIQGDRKKLKALSVIIPPPPSAISS